MRVIGGNLRGRRLEGPQSRAVRPTSDRLRQTIFDILAHAYGEPTDGARALDLFAGAGAMGIEALSRGASFCLFVDAGAEALGLIRRNLGALNLDPISQVLRGDATRLRRPPGLQAFSLAFLDPPYNEGLAPPALRSLEAGGWLAPGALVVVEDSRKAAFDAPVGFDALETRDCGDARLTFLRHRGDAT